MSAVVINFQQRRQEALLLKPAQFYRLEKEPLEALRSISEPYYFYIVEPLHSSNTAVAVYETARVRSVIARAQPLPEADAEAPISLANETVNVLSDPTASRIDLRRVLEANFRFYCATQEARNSVKDPRRTGTAPAGAIFHMAAQRPASPGTAFHSLPVAWASDVRTDESVLMDIALDLIDDGLERDARFFDGFRVIDFINRF